MEKAVKTQDDLLAEIQAVDPTFDPEKVSDGSHPLKKVFDNSFYPETKAIIRAKTIEYQVLDTPANLEWLLVNKFDAKIRFNRMNWTREIELPGMFIYKEDAQNSALALVDYLATLNDFPTKKLDQHLTYIAQKNAYHPIIECIEATPWDGIPRLDKFTETIKTTTPHSKIMIKTWMVSGIAAAISEEGFINHGVLVLQGDQEVGKTTWVRNLDPIPNGKSVKEGAFLDPSRQDSVIMMSSYWIVELGELETIFKKSDIGRLKAFITTQFDHVRFSYARKPTQMPRRSIYIATVNQFNFLVDDTGNRRWWTLEVTEIDNNHGLDMQQVWAEVYHEWQSGHLTYLSKDIQRQVNLSNEKHERIDPYQELLAIHYDWSSIPRRSMTATEILKEVGIKTLGRSESTRMGSVLVKFTGNKPTKSSGKMVHQVPYMLLNSNQHFK